MTVSRRKFLTASALATVASTFSTPAVFGAVGDKKYRTALVGCGWWGTNILNTAIQTKSVEPVAMVDVDRRQLEPGISSTPPFKRNPSNPWRWSMSIGGNSNLHSNRSKRKPVPHRKRSAIIGKCSNRSNRTSSSMPPRTTGTLSSRLPPAKPGRMFTSKSRSATRSTKELRWSRRHGTRSEPFKSVHTAGCRLTMWQQWNS